MKKEAVLSALALLAAEGVSAWGVGRRLPAEKRQLTDPVTGVTLEVLTTDPANDQATRWSRRSWFWYD